MTRSPGSVNCRPVDRQFSPVVDKFEQVIAVPLRAGRRLSFRPLTAGVLMPVSAPIGWTNTLPGVECGWIQAASSRQWERASESEPVPAVSTFAERPTTLSEPLDGQPPTPTSSAGQISERGESETAWEARSLHPALHPSEEADAPRHP